MALPADRHTGLIPANVTTLAHFSVSSAISLPKSAGTTRRALLLAFPAPYTRKRASEPKKGIDVEEVLAKVRALCLPVSHRVISETDPDRLLVTSVNVPFANRIDSEGLAEVIRTGRIPPGYRGHIERFLGEIPLSRLLAFFDRHHIDASTVAKFVREQGGGLALHRPDLQEHLRVLSGR